MMITQTHMSEDEGAQHYDSCQGRACARHGREALV